MNSTNCSTCGNPLEDNRVNKQRNCLACHNKYMRANRKRHKDLTPEQKLKANCRSYVNVYIKRGKISKQSCSVCGNIKAEAHHEDYSKPLDIIWLCRLHHLELHQKQ